MPSSIARSTTRRCSAGLPRTISPALPPQPKPISETRSSVLPTCRYSTVASLMASSCRLHFQGPIGHSAPKLQAPGSAIHHHLPHGLELGLAFPELLVYLLQKADRLTIIIPFSTRPTHGNPDRYTHNIRRDPQLLSDLGDLDILSMTENTFHLAL